MWGGEGGCGEERGGGGEERGGEFVGSVLGQLRDKVFKSWVAMVDKLYAMYDW